MLILMKLASTQDRNFNDLIVTDEMFTNRALVEVSSDEEGFHGSWFAATLVKSLRKGKFLIEYKCLSTEDGSELLREEVDNMHIRPHPRENVVDHFKQLDEVDALFNEGWWVGVISKVLTGSRYIVYFRETCEELEFQHSELRLHQDWIDGKWVIPSRVWPYLILTTLFDIYQLLCFSVLWKFL
ncbi:protein AGENET DOMAIN (AGD)-CONTAINING P1 isoform X2 [Argentina anserina]|uniref:protein AGENET DOMAIN (AGD)-CONTAINING P1 isoform X2 n=1 Tax=Argentina anserina TaxID=57926 RepID=UPI002176533D|nr:protein AGENET DOMAIN (AGD)-CONTAINING P1 isoform X2 [Potentilla anserina]